MEWATYLMLAQTTPHPGDMTIGYALLFLLVAWSLSRVVGKFQKRANVAHSATAAPREIAEREPARVNRPSVALPDEGAQPAWSLFSGEREKQSASRIGTMPLEQRGHTLLAKRSGGGKTQRQISLMVGDIASGHQVYWLSTHSTLYNEDDQVTDLRLIADRFARSRKGDEIIKALEEYGGTELDKRLEMYDENPAALKRLPAISLHIGEYLALHEDYGARIVKPIRRILREGRKARIFLGSVDMQDGRATGGLSTALLQAFWTKYAGELDLQSWRNLGLPGMPPKMSKYEWFVSYDNESGEQTTERAAFGLTPDAMILDIAHSGATVERIEVAAVEQSAPRDKRAVSADEVADAINVCITRDGKFPSRAAVEVELYGYSGGHAFKMVSAVWADALLLLRGDEVPTTA